MEYTFKIRGRFCGGYCFPNLNNLLEVQNLRDHGNSYKKKYMGYAERAIQAQLHGVHIDKQVTVHYVIGEPDKKRDVSNVVAGAVKIIEDAMQRTRPKLIDNDNPTHIKDFSHEIRYIGKKELPYIIVTLTEVDK